MTSTRWSAVMRLTALLAGTSLALSRLGLVLHELIGHGVVATALGATVSDVQLFWFAGGWIRYRVLSDSVATALAIALGGIGAETCVGLALWIGLAGATSLGRRLVRTIGAALLTHAMFYLAIGSWHGFGDGRLIYELAGVARAPIAIAAGAIACLAAWSGARYLFGALLATVPAPRLAGTLAAIAVAGAFNAALDLGELRVRRDAVYAATMQPQRERIVARELAAWQRAQPAAVSAADRAAAERDIADRHREWPLGWVLGTAVAAAIVAGAARSPASPDIVVGVQLVVVAWAVAATATAAVIAIDAAFG